MVHLSLKEIEEALRNAEDKLLKATEKRADKEYISMLKKDVNHFRDLRKEEIEKLGRK